jgi:hypothetical protein
MIRKKPFIKKSETTRCYISDVKYACDFLYPSDYEDDELEDTVHTR